jgi:murein DD-endopeptidase MepM/ murein hydrolase activator NlpD
LLSDIEAFAAEPTSTPWVALAVRVHRGLETEFQNDGYHFGDVPLHMSEQVPRTLALLSRRISEGSIRVPRVDPAHFRWPVTSVLVTSPYGDRLHPILNEPRFHAGVDLDGEMRSPIHAAEAGFVIFAGWNGAHGQQIEVQHDAHWATRYSHLDALLVKPGMQVTKGQVIGFIGDSGQTTGPHLHFELRRDGAALDPEVFLRRSPASLVGN